MNSQKIPASKRVPLCQDQIPLDQAVIQGMACDVIAETEEPLSRQSLADLVRRARSKLGEKISRSTVSRMLHESAIKPWQHEHIDFTPSSYAGPKRVRAMIHICQHTSQNERWDECDRIQMGGSKKRGTQ